MRFVKKYFLKILLVFPFLSFTQKENEWLTKKYSSFAIHYTKADENNMGVYANLVTTGKREVEEFFHAKYKNNFDVFVHYNRASLDSTWQKDWNMPAFKSECWMVASGVATKLDMISPKQWNKESCEHKYEDSIATQQLITHELVHVFHGQYNKSPDFSDVDNIDWFVEGLATYVSGQCSCKRITEIQKAISENKIPSSLNDFWKGDMRYGLSGAVVMYIDKTYGREKLKQLLPLNKKQDILSTLNISENDLLQNWKKFIANYSCSSK